MNFLALYHKYQFKKIDINLPKPTWKGTFLEGVMGASSSTAFFFFSLMEWKLGIVWKCPLWKCLHHESVLIASAVIVLIVPEKQEAGEKEEMLTDLHKIWHLSTRQRGCPRICLFFYLHWQKSRKQQQQKAHRSGGSAAWAPSLLLWLSPLETCRTLKDSFHGECNVRNILNVKR